MSIRRFAARTIPLLVVLLCAAPLRAEITTDGSVGPALTLPGPDMTIGAKLGTTKGANLFHSFKTFDLRRGESATFTGPDAIRNVIGRVTGG